MLRRPSVIRRRRAANSAFIASTWSRGPSSAAMPAFCVKVAAHDTLLTASRTTCGTNSGGMMP